MGAQGCSPVGPMDRNNWRATVLILTTRLPFTFGWLVGDAEWATGVLRGTHGHEWGDFFRRSGGLVKGAPERLMAAYLTWRGMPLLRRLVPVPRRAHQPLVPQPQPGTYGNASVARMTGGGAPHNSSSNLHPVNCDHHQRATVGQHSGNQGHRCTRSGTIGDRRATKLNDLHVLECIPLHSPHHHPLTTPAADHRSHRHYGRSGTIGGRKDTKPPARTCIQTGGTTTAAAARHRRSDPGAPVITCREEKHAQPHEYGNRKRQARATPRHHAPTNGPRPGPRRRPGSQPQTPLDVSTRGHRPAAPTRAYPKPHPHHSPPVRPKASPAHIPADGPPTQTRTATLTDATSARPERPLGTMRPEAQSPLGAPVPRLQQHPACRPQGTIRRPRHRPNRHPSNATTNQLDRQYRPRKHHLAVTGPPAWTGTRTRRTPPSWLMPRGQTHQATSCRQGFRIRRAGHKQQGLPQQRGVAARGHWEANLETSPGQHPCRMAKPGRRRQ